MCMCLYMHIYFLFARMFSHLVSFHCFLAFTVSDEKLTFVLNIVFLYVMSFFFSPVSALEIFPLFSSNLTVMLPAVVFLIQLGVLKPCLFSTNFFISLLQFE